MQAAWWRMRILVDRFYLPGASLCTKPERRP
jgi:hypothetical protein